MRKGEVNWLIAGIIAIAILAIVFIGGIMGGFDLVNRFGNIIPDFNSTTKNSAEFLIMRYSLTGDEISYTFDGVNWVEMESELAWDGRVFERQRVKDDFIHYFYELPLRKDFSGKFPESEYGLLPTSRVIIRPLDTIPGKTETIRTVSAGNILDKDGTPYGMFVVNYAGDSVWLWRDKINTKKWIGGREINSEWIQFAQMVNQWRDSVVKGGENQADMDLHYLVGSEIKQASFEVEKIDDYLVVRVLENE